MTVKIIKRHRNRRLYDAQESRTVTLADLATMVRKGIDLKVVDSVSGKDVTLPVLGRVMLFTTSSGGDWRQTKEVITEIIQLGGDRSMSILKNTLLASIGILHVTKEKAEKIIDDLIKRGDLDKSDRKKAVMELLKKAEKSTSEIGKKVGQEVQKVQKEVTKRLSEFKLGKLSDFKRLEAKVDKLNKAVAKIEKKLSSM